MKIRVHSFIKKLASMLPGQIVFYLRFLWKHRYWPQINSPRTYTEKILWLMAWDNHPLRAIAADRIKVRDFVAKNAPHCKFPEHLWTGKSLTLEVWNELPKKFVLKANHGSKMVLIIDKDQDAFDAVSNKSASWLAKDYSLEFGEWVYQTVPRLLIVEEKLEIDNQIPPDWKFFCASGKVFLVMMNTDRTEHSEIDTFYLSDFSQLNDLSMDYDHRTNSEVKKPLCFDNAVQIAMQLSASFDFIRVDLYLIGHTVYFGELTCFPAAGMDAIKPIHFDFEFGSKIQLDKSHMLNKPRPIWTKFP